MITQPNNDHTNDAAASLAEPLVVGGVTIRNRVFLAPMSGISDAPFRRLAWERGAGLVISEMVASDQLAIGNADAELTTGQGPHVVQLAGREEPWMAEGCPRGRGSRRRHNRHQYGLPRQKSDSRLLGLGADA